MTKFVMIQALLNYNVDFYNCGRPGSKSYEKLSNYLHRLNKSELQAMLSEFIDAEKSQNNGEY